MKELHYLCSLGVFALFGMVSVAMAQGKDENSSRPTPAQEAGLPESSEQGVATWQERGLAYMENGEHQLAIESYTEAIRSGDTHAWLYFARAVCYLEIKDYESALADFSETIQLGEEQPCTYALRAACHTQLGRSGNAYADYTTAIRLDPQKAGAYWACIEAGSKHQALLADYDKALQLRPNDPEIYFLRGEFYACVLSKHAKAIEDYTKAIELVPANALYFERRGLLYVMSAPKRQLPISTGLSNSHQNPHPTYSCLVRSPTNAQAISPARSMTTARLLNSVPRNLGATDAEGYCTHKQARPRKRLLISRLLFVSTIPIAILQRPTTDAA